MLCIKPKQIVFSSCFTMFLLLLGSWFGPIITKIADFVYYFYVDIRVKEPTWESLAR